MEMLSKLMYSRRIFCQVDHCLFLKVEEKEHARQLVQFKNSPVHV